MLTVITYRNSQDISQEAVRLGRHIYKALEDEFLHQISAEAIQDTLIANEYTYLSDGRCFTMPSSAYGR